MAVDQLVTTSEYGYTVVKANTNADFKAPKTQIPVGDLDMYAHFRFLSSNNTDVTANYTVETSDRTTLMVADGTAAKANQKVHVVGIKEGSAYINVKDVNGNIVKSLPVTVVASRKLARVQLDSSNVVISNEDLTAQSLKDDPASGWESVTTRSVGVKGYDQYGDLIPVSVVSISNTANAPDDLVKASNTSGSSILIDGAQTPNAGNYSYRLTVTGGGVSQLYSFSVRVVDPKPLLSQDQKNGADLNDVNARGGRENYRLVVSPRSYDATITSATTAAKKDDKINVRIGVYESGALIGYLPIIEGNWDNASKNDTLLNKVNYSNPVFTGTSTTTSASIDLYKAIGARTYRVRAWAKLKLNGANSGETKVEFYDDIAITDSANGAAISKWTVSRFSTSVTNLRKESSDADKVTAAKDAIVNCLNVSCFGDLVPADVSNFYVEARDLTVTNNAVFIKKAYVVKEIDGVNYAVPFTINLTFTVQ